MSATSTDPVRDRVPDLIRSAVNRIRSKNNVGFGLFEGQRYIGYWENNLNHFAQLFDDTDNLKEVVLGRARISDRSLELMFWIAAHSVHDVLWEATLPGYYEPYHNVALPSHLSAKHWFYTLAEYWSPHSSKPVLRYLWADCTKGGLESRVGADFVFVTPVERGQWRIMFVQAKRVSARTIAADLKRSVGPDPGREQIEILQATNNLFREATGLKSVDFAHYLFWHDMLADGSILPPSITPFSAVMRQLRGFRFDVLRCTQTLDFTMYVTLDFSRSGDDGGPGVSQSVIERIFSELPDEQRPAKVLALSANGLDLVKTRSFFDALKYRTEISSDPESEGSPPAVHAEPHSEEKVWNPAPKRKIRTGYA